MVWYGNGMTSEQRQAFEEFRAIVKRYGKWSPDVELFVDAVAQLPLAFAKEPA